MADLLPKGFEQRWLWVDPLVQKADIGAVLRAEEILQYVKDFNLIIDQDDFKDDHLKGASYSMMPDPSEGWILDTKGSHDQKKLELKVNARGEYFVVPKNAFVFIRLRQRLRVPYYLIGRFNLKIRYVYQGLLLGTGPQIDPGYTGRIYIPLHNFTNEVVKVYVNETFVSFEFARTTPIKLSEPVPTSLDEFYRDYEGPLRLIDPKKIKDRDHLQAYLEEARPYSALGVLVEDLEGMRKEFKTRKFIEIAVAIGIVALAVTVVGLAINYGSSTGALLSAATDRDHRLEAEVQSQSKQAAVTKITTASQVQELSKKVEQLETRLQGIEQRERAGPTPIAQVSPKN